MAVAERALLKRLQWAGVPLSCSTDAPHGARRGEFELVDSWGLAAQERPDAWWLHDRHSHEGRRWRAAAMERFRRACGGKNGRERVAVVQTATSGPRRRASSPRMSAADELVTAQYHQPAVRCVAMEPYSVEPSLDHSQLEELAIDAAKGAQAGSANALLLLRRRNDVTMYGKLFDADSYSAATPDYVALRLFDDAESASQAREGAAPLLLASGGSGGVTPLSPKPLLWDATLVERPELAATLEPGVPCFLAMNRFPVRAECAMLFEERWASRTTMLTRQPGLIGFSLLRRRAALPDERADGEEPYTYSTATLWASQAAWGAWREGEGRNAHAASKGLQRTPVSEWMEYGMAASPIFFDVPIYFHGARGISHVASRSM